MTIHHLAKLQHEALSVSPSIAKPLGNPAVGLAVSRKPVKPLQVTKDKEEELPVEFYKTVVFDL